MNDKFKELRELALASIRSGADLLDELDELEHVLVGCNQYGIDSYDKMAIRATHHHRGLLKQVNHWENLDKLEEKAWKEVIK